MSTRLDRRASIAAEADAHPIPHRVRNEIIATLGEFAGTFMFLFMAFSAAQVANWEIPADTDPAAHANGPAPLQIVANLFIAAAFASSLAVNVWIFYRVTGGMFNPAVTLGLVLVGVVKPARAILVVAAQLIGGICAAGVTHALFPGTVSFKTSLGPTISPTRAVFIEMFLTAELVLTVFLLAVEKHRATFLAPVGIGAALFVAHNAGVWATGASLNPARSFGPEVVAGFASHDWVYWVGPGLGALLAYAVYRVLKLLRYETANPGQDADDVEEAAGDATADDGPQAKV